MHKVKLPPPAALTRWLALLISCAVILASAYDPAAGQSGRKPKQGEQKGVQLPADPPPEAKPAPTEAKKPAMPIIVTRDLHRADGFYYLSDVMAHGCAERLKQSQALDVRLGKQMSRKEASDHAKNSADTYVVLLQLEDDRLGRMGNDRYDDITVSYFLYAPTTGKARASGRVPLRPYQPRAGGIPIPVPGGRATAEMLVKQAGSDAADRILSALDMIVSRSGD